MSLFFEGRHIAFDTGDTIAEALLRAGVTAFSRGPKYHRPRGPFCLNDTCGQCHMRVGGEPNVPTCIEPAADGVEVSRQNVLGTGDLDLLRAVDFLYPEGLDHHHLMTRFKLLNAATQLVARRLAGVGQIPTTDVPPVEVVRREVPVVIVGAGHSGLRVGRLLAQAGVRPLLLEARSHAGGWSETTESGDCGEVALGTRVLGLYPEGNGARLIARGPGSMWQLNAQHVIVATGGIERPLLFESNDLPGIYAGRAFSRLRTMPGKRAVILGADPDALRVAERVARQLEIVAVLDMAGTLSSTSVPVLRAQPLRAVGTSHVTGLRVRSAEGDEGTLECDVILAVSPLAPAFELAGEAGARSELERSGFAVMVDGAGATAVPWLRVVGATAGHRAVPDAVSAELVRAMGGGA